MKMNSLDALHDLLSRVAAGRADLRAFAPRTYAEAIDGQSIAALGEQPIRHMRDLQRTRSLPRELVARVASP